MVKIISDSSTLYSIEEGKKLNLGIASLLVTINNETYAELEDIQTKEFIDIIKQGHVPISSQPAIGQVVELYEQHAEEQILNISIADGLSGTYNTACMAKEMVANRSNITVFNSKTLCGPHRYLVDLAIKLNEENKSLEEIVDVLTAVSDTSSSFLMPHDFEFLVRGGRVSSIAGLIGGAIKLVPIMKLKEDGMALEKFATKRTFTKAIQKVIDTLVESNIDETYKIYVVHAADEALAQTAKEAIESRIENADIEMHLLTPAFTTHGGPGCVAIQYIKKYEA